MDKNKEKDSLQEFYEAQRISDELSDYYLEYKSIKDNELLSDFIDSNPHSKDLIDALSSKEAHRKASSFFNNSNEDQDFKKLLKSVSLSGQKNKRRRSLYLWTASSAAVLLVLIFVGVRYVWNDKEPGNAAVESILPGTGRAILTYSDGRSVGIEQEELVIDADGTPLLADSAFNNAAHAPAAQNTFATLTIPRGGEFFVTLPDNTKVWLNSETELRFPSTFSDSERRVTLRGEAFFDVAHDNKRAFTVQLAQGDFTVYGTRFNVKQYDDSPLTAVLVDGSIGFTSGSGNHVVMEPSQMMQYDSAGDRIDIKTVDVSLYTSWIDNLFIFKRQSLDEIMSTLSRWYDVDVVFENGDAARAILSCQLYRSDELGVLLKVFEKSAGVRFRVEGKTVYIDKK